MNRNMIKAKERLTSKDKDKEGEKIYIFFFVTAHSKQLYSRWSDNIIGLRTIHHPKTLKYPGG